MCGNLADTTQFKEGKARMHTFTLSKRTELQWKAKLIFPLTGKIAGCYICQ